MEVKVIRKAVDIECDCPKCDVSIKMSYSDFVDIVGEPFNWSDSKFFCPLCGEHIEIDSIDWD
jgi:predicted RNA-binding Zn-ribbon protein involved in translation (DUF1610 family)